MIPEAEEHLRKARDSLRRARIILAAGVGEDAGRNAYLAAFHAAQALIRVRMSRAAKTHRGVHALFARLAKDDPTLVEHSRFLSRAYNLKALADYELGPGTDVPLDRAGAAIDNAEQFVDRISQILA